MPVKLKYGTKTSFAAKSKVVLHSRLFRIALIACLGVLVVGSLVFGYFYYHYQRVVDDRLASGPIFASVSQIYAASPQVRDGQKLSAGNGPHCDLLRGDRDSGAAQRSARFLRRRDALTNRQLSQSS